MKKGIIIFLSCIAVAVIAAVIVWYYTREKQPQGQEITNVHPTDGPGYFVAPMPQADTLIVGKWQCTANPQWYKVYYDDYDEEEKMFWGKEWDEKEDVYEEDLNYHGNGWFLWEKKGNMLHEYASMDNHIAPIFRAYKIRKSTVDSLVCNERDYKKIIFRFARVK